MIATIPMTGARQELPIDIWIEKKKLANRITEKTWAVDWFGALYDSICLTASEDNVGVILVSDYTEENQQNDWTQADWVELWPKGRIELPWNRKVQALNRPMVLWTAWDILKVVAR